MEAPERQYRTQVLRWFVETGYVDGGGIGFWDSTKESVEVATQQEAEALRDQWLAEGKLIETHWGELRPAWSYGAFRIRSLWDDVPTSTLAARLVEVERELDLMKTAGIIEVAARNPSVLEYMQHWEGRAEAAEARADLWQGKANEHEDRAERLTAALRPFADFADGNVDDEGWSGREQGARIVDWFGPSDFRAARAALQQEGGE